MTEPRYVVTALYEPNGKGCGWYDAPSDDVATFFSVDDSDPEGLQGHDGAETRAAAQAIANRMNAESAR